MIEEKEFRTLFLLTVFALSNYITYRIARNLNKEVKREMKGQVKKEIEKENVLKLILVGDSDKLTSSDSTHTVQLPIGDKEIFIRIGTVKKSKDLYQKPIQSPKLFSFKHLSEEADSESDFSAEEVSSSSYQSELETSLFQDPHATPKEQDETVRESILKINKQLPNSGSLDPQEEGASLRLNPRSITTSQESAQIRYLMDTEGLSQKQATESLRVLPCDIQRATNILNDIRSESATDIPSHLLDDPTRTPEDMTERPSKRSFTFDIDLPEQLEFVYSLVRNYPHCTPNYVYKHFKTVFPDKKVFPTNIRRAIERELDYGFDNTDQYKEYINHPKAIEARFDWALRHIAHSTDFKANCVFISENVILNKVSGESSQNMEKDTYMVAISSKRLIHLKKIARLHTLEDEEDIYEPKKKDNSLYSYIDPNYFVDFVTETLEILNNSRPIHFPTHIILPYRVTFPDTVTHLITAANLEYDFIPDYSDSFSPACYFWKDFRKSSRVLNIRKNGKTWEQKVVELRSYFNSTKLTEYYTLFIYKTNKCIKRENI